MKRLEKIRHTSPALEALAQATIDLGKTDFEYVKQQAQELFILTGDQAVRNYTFPRLSIRRLWNLKKMTYDAGPYKGKKIFSTRDSSKHIVTVLRAQGYNIKFPNNLDFLHNLLKEYKINTFEEFSTILKERSPQHFGSYAQVQIDAMIEFGHLGD